MKNLVKTHVKKLGAAAVFVAAVGVFGISSAHAESVRLADIFTDHCLADQSELDLLNKADVHLHTVCESGGFIAPNGQYYRSKLVTRVAVPFAVGPGTTIRLADIDTNHCARAQELVELLNTSSAHIDTFCEAGSFLGHNGFYYNFRLNTSIIVNN